MNNQPEKRIFYGWFTLAGVMLIIFFVGGAFFQSFGVLLPVITAEFGWKRDVVAGALSSGIIAFGLPSPFWGLIVTRLGPRITLIFGNLLAGLGIAGIFFVQEIWHLYALYILIGMGGGIGGYVSCTTVINNWFIKKRSLALGIFAACSGLCGLVFPPLVTALISVIDWRLTWLILAVMIIVVAVLLGGVILVRNKPEDMGQMPDGMAADTYDDLLVEEASLKAARPAGEWRLTQVLKGRTVWLIGAFAAANTFTMGMMVTHQIAYLQDIGYQPMTAAITISFMSVFSIAGSLVFGMIALRINARHLAMMAFLIQLLGLITIITSKSLGFIYLYAALQGMSTGALTTAMPTIVGAYHPREHYARVMGVVAPFQVCSNAIGAYIAGLIFVASGSYLPAFITAAVLCAAGFCFVSLARRPRVA